MPIDRSSPFFQHPFRWLLKVLSFGFFSTALVGLALQGFHWNVLKTYGAIGSIFALVMWGGFELGWPMIRATGRNLTPMGYALRSQVRWFLLYCILWAISVGLIRLLLGLNLVADLFSSMLAFMIGMGISSFVVNVHVTAHLVEATQALERSRTHASFLALKSQLSPHTLFNALNTVASLIPEEPRKAEDAVEHLSQLLRRILDALELESWPLQEEFALLEDLLRLEQARFGPRLSYELDLAEDQAERPVPPLVLLPLVENALKHGFRPKVGPCRLRVQADQKGIRVQDDGVGLTSSTSEGKGLGLRLARERLVAHGGSLEIQSLKTGFLVNIRLTPS